MDQGPGRVIYVGSIPYDQTEEQILDIFRSVGPVVNFRLVFDKDSGKSKGFGFVEYHDAETAASAVRNLNNYQIGSRYLKVDFSHETTITPAAKPKVGKFFFFFFFLTAVSFLTFNLFFRSLTNTASRHCVSTRNYCP